MVTTNEHTALFSMVFNHRLSYPAHLIHSKNGVIHQTHYSYRDINNNTYLVGQDNYTGSTLEAQQFFTYDSIFSMLTSSNTLGGKPTTYLYGYNNIAPVLTVTNAYPNEVYYQGFEEENDDPDFSIGHAHTGLYYYNANYTVYFSKPDSKSYVIQWWNYSGDKWVFHEQAYTGPTTLTGPVDDIRIFPIDALVSSTTYEPMVGKTSELDPNGKLTAYEYDGLGRPNGIRDNDGNLIKQMCYSYLGHALSCPSVYYSREISRAFTRNNCGVDSGATIFYTIPAGQYTSSSSQQEANQSAQNDITANGQAYANDNGQCILVYTPIYPYNYTDYTVYLTFHLNGQNFNFTVNANASGNLGLLPLGDYSLTVSCTSPIMVEAGCGDNNSGSGPSFTIPDFQISKICNTIWIDPYSEGLKSVDHTASKKDNSLKR